MEETRGVSIQERERARDRAPASALCSSTASLSSSPMRIPKPRPHDPLRPAMECKGQDPRGPVRREPSRAEVLQTARRNVLKSTQ
ncbi:hypothetical protein Q7C36_016814 [Tachysurus vachellii]|uniref:Uncharacterized protein n=1 Tax=Tachysurus vachellii TaxID=175792 RepID=A0AA88M950_TACVA|nr:hypothetical protein Q7C36_016814 [Tachysurus vachellii]